MVGPPSDVHRQVSAFFVYWDNNREDEYGMAFEGWPDLFNCRRHGFFYCFYGHSIQKRGRQE